MRGERESQKETKTGEKVKQQKGIMEGRYRYEMWPRIRAGLTNNA